MSSEPRSYPAPRALVVDDDPEGRAVLRHALEMEGWQVVEARDGREALERESAVRPDVVITDLEMPGMDGVELASRLRERREDLPLLAVTRRPPEEAGTGGDPFDAVLRKPVSLPALRGWLAEH